MLFIWPECEQLINKTSLYDLQNNYINADVGIKYNLPYKFRKTTHLPILKDLLLIHGMQWYKELYV